MHCDSVVALVSETLRWRRGGGDGDDGGAEEGGRKGEREDKREDKGWVDEGRGEGAWLRSWSSRLTPFLLRSSRIHNTLGITNHISHLPAACSIIGPRGIKRNCFHI